MIGAIIGDMVGSVYEFNNTRNYNFTLFTNKSDITDDSILTLAIADWAMEDKTLSHEVLEEKLVKFVFEFPNPMGGYGGGFLNWVFNPKGLCDFRGANNSMESDKPLSKSLSGRHPYNSWGNGSAMRVSGVGWIFDTLVETEHAAELSASITHNHPEGIKGAQAVAAAIFLARHGSSKQEIKEYITHRFGYNLEQDWEDLHRSYRWDSSCQGTVPQAMIAFLQSHDFEDAIRKAVSMGGDSDTLACITGGISEAYYHDIPDFMLNRAVSSLPVHLLSVYNKFKTMYKNK